MSVGTSSLTAAVTAATKRMIVSGGPAWFRQLVTLTVTGLGNPANFILMAYRGSTLVALCQSFAGPDDAAVGTLDTNTTELEDAIDDADVSANTVFGLDVFLYDSVTTEFLGAGTLELLVTRDYGATSPVSPIADTTVFAGSFAIYNGKTYLRSATDGLYYEFAAYGTGASATESLETTGITIPGAP